RRRGRGRRPHRADARRQGRRQRARRGGRARRRAGHGRPGEPHPVTGVWLRARSEMRSDRRSLVALAVMLGLISAVVLTAGAGARRTDTPYPRLRASIKSPDVFVISGKDPHGPIPVVDLRKALRLPQVSFGVLGQSISGVALSLHNQPLWGGNLNLGGPP